MNMKGLCTLADVIAKTQAEAGTASLKNIAQMHHLLLHSKLSLNQRIKRTSTDQRQLWAVVSQRSTHTDAAIQRAT